MTKTITVEDFKTYLDEEKRNAKIEDNEFNYSHCEALIEGLYDDGMIEEIECAHQIFLLERYFAKWYPSK